MSDELDLRKGVERASHAQRLLEDEMLKEAFDNYERELSAAWLSEAGTPHTREQAYWAMRALSAVRASLENIMADGVLAKRELDGILDR